MSRLRKIAENISNEIADQFVVGFYDGRMVEMHADLIEKHIIATVEECCKVILERRYQHMVGIIPPENAKKLVENVKEHFGVK